jgi:hypothetical protein
MHDEIADALEELFAVPTISDSDATGWPFCTRIAPSATTDTLTEDD